MIKHLTIPSILLAALFFSCGKPTTSKEPESQNIEQKVNLIADKNDKIYKGDIELTTQKEIDDFGKNNYSFFDGNLSIGNTKSTEYNEEIFNLDALKSIKTINGDLMITKINSLESVAGLSNLEKVNGSFDISGCGTKLTKIENFEKLTTVNGDIIFGNNIGKYGKDGIREINTFNNLKKVNNIYITGNSGLKALNAFNTLEEVKTIYISNTEIEALSNFKNLKSINENFSIEFSDKLTSIIFPNLEVVKGHFALNEDSKINGNIHLPKLKKLSNFYLASNASFENYCDLASHLKQNKIDTLTADFNKVDFTKEQVLQKCK